MLRKILLFFPNILYKILEKITLSIVHSHQGEIAIHGWTILSRRTVLGKNPNFNGLHVYGKGKVVFGDNFHSGIECMIITQNHNYEGKTIPYDDTYIIKDVTIGDNVWFGSRVTILGGVTIGEGAIIQAGAVVVKDIPPCAIAGGNPATVFKYRDKEHYYSLKSQGKFH